jgi:hypothetical protein
MADRPKVTDEMVKEQARLGAVFYNEIVKSVDPVTALELAAKYLTTLVCIALNTQPKEPWET